jgi:hypothetical protein
MSGDSAVSDQALIPITAENGKRSARESVDLTLTDYEGTSYKLCFRYGAFSRFYLLPDTSGLKLDSMALDGQKRYLIRSGMRLSVGTREYTLVVARGGAHTEMLRKFAS